MDASSVLGRMAQERALAILRTDDQERAYRAMDAAVRGGFRVIEFTLGCPGAYELIAEFARRSDLVVGVGTALRVDQAEKALAAGARFVVSPVVDEAVIQTALDADAVAVPGTFTATEMGRAHSAGAQLQKLFPAPTNGPEYIRMIMGPMPFLRIVPTSGVTAGNAADFLAAGAFGVGFVGSLFRPEDLAAGAFDAIERRAAQCVAAVAGALAGKEMTA